MAQSHPLVRLETLALIAIGGFVGATLRHLLALVFPGLAGTFLANSLGSFLLGFILYEAIYTELLSEKTHLVAATGLLSSFTTYSTFALQTMQAALPFGVLNVVASYAFGFGGVLLGAELAAQLEVE
ncbi:fluoride efflux transporter FluC [Halorarum salinum]|uniref:Fluoride-specific ion channel FluC n=1 Tax=Halorarum salinum TaxID=2743089 RepID=A0A7D5LD66_9EURY|nr:CrcB family protein [Halobaculum salinum]QLG64113.1 CrcB family protein [Halobaculum salinum]